MLDFIIALLFLGLTFSFIEIDKAYHLLPIEEIKFRVRNNDRIYTLIYQVNSFQGLSKVLVWVLIVVSSSISLILFDKSTPLIISFLAIVLFIFYLFIWLPNKNSTKIGNFFVRLYSPAIIKILNFSYPLLGRIKFLTKQKSSYKHQVFDFYDLKEFLKQLGKSEDVRINRDEAKILQNLTNFFTKPVSDYSIPWSKVKKIKSEDPFSPIILDELYKSKQSFIPVIDQNKTPIGMLDIKNLNLKKEGKVKDYMSQDLFFLNEEDGLIEIFLAFQKTLSRVFLIVDQSEKISGLISLDMAVDVLLQNKHLVNDFNYSSLANVSQKYLPKEETIDDKIEPIE